jgi:hypothetical protein
VTDPRAVAPVDCAHALAQLADIAEQARDCAGAAKAPSTLRGYRTDWRAFAASCERHRLEALPSCGLADLNCAP